MIENVDLKHEMTDGERVLPINNPLNAAILGHELLALAADQSEWSQATFGTDQERGPVGAWRHLPKECEETVEAWESLLVANPEDRPRLAAKVAEEQADQLLLFLDGNRRSGLSLLDVVKAAHRKMKVNRTRIYHRTPDSVPAEHDRSGEGKAKRPSWWRWLVIKMAAALSHFSAWAKRNDALCYFLGSIICLLAVILLIGGLVR